MIFLPTSVPPHAVRAPSSWACGVLKLTAVGAAALLTACANVQLPPWTGASAPAPLKASQTAPAPSAPTAPVAVSQPVARAPQLTALPYNPVIEARFPDPSTRYDTPGLRDERRQFTTQAEMEAWLQALAGKAGNGQHLDSISIGTSQRGLPIPALIAAQASGTQATALNSNGKPTILLVGQQRGDEPASAEALLIIAQELGRGGLLAPLLQQINIIIVPRANPDAAETASRLTADGTDLIHDHLTLSTPEAQALAQLVRNYRPAAVMDLREFAAGGMFLQKFRAVQRYDVLLQPAATANAHEFVNKAAREWFAEPMRNALSQSGLSNEWYYETSPATDDKSLSMASLAADTLDNSSSLKNAAAVLISSRGSDLGRLHIQRRVHSLVTAATSALRATAEKAANLNQVESFVTRETASLACRNMLTIQAQQTPEQRTISMLQADTGQELQARVDWNSSLTLKSSQTRPRPCGYWVSAGSSQAVERLRMLGVQVMQIAEPGQMLADSYQTQRSASPVLTRGAIDAPAGSYYVSLNQAKAHLIAAALEPDTPYSYVSKSLITTPSDIARVVAAPSVVFEEEAE
ncbi:M14 family zinc carboxypeptidase [Comamonas guangdongensis]|uniref:M14 family zinc carboxypeptidase n=1 Tax=Comamonas guangdongensis TaxID=510515 RepID=UPI003F6E040C